MTLVTNIGDGISLWVSVPLRKSGFLFFISGDKHHYKCQQQQYGRYKDCPFMEVFNTLVSDDRPADKAKDNSVIEKPFFKSFSFFCLEERVNILCAASQVSDAHSSSDTISMNFTKTFYLNATGEGQ